MLLIPTIASTSCCHVKLSTLYLWLSGRNPGQSVYCCAAKHCTTTGSPMNNRISIRLRLQRLRGRITVNVQHRNNIFWTEKSGASYSVFDGSGSTAVSESKQVRKIMRYYYSNNRVYCCHLKSVYGSYLLRNPGQSVYCCKAQHNNRHSSPMNNLFRYYAPKEEE